MGGAGNGPGNRLELTSYFRTYSYTRSPYHTTTTAAAIVNYCCLTKVYSYLLHHWLLTFCSVKDKAGEEQKNRLHSVPPSG